MAFKSVTTYNEEKFGGLFLLRNDGDSADVVFLYRDINDVLVADTHYIKSADYSGYVHCCGKGCPACAKGIRTQTKLFIPLYNIGDDEIQFFDRSIRFEPQLTKDVFDRFPNPCDFVFTITRHGVAGDVNTTYEIKVAGKNTLKSYQEILADRHATFPEYYEHICRDISADVLRGMLNSSNVGSNGSSYVSAPDVPAYIPTPRVSVPPINKLDVVEDHDTDNSSLPFVPDSGMQSTPPSVVPTELPDELEELDEEDAVF